MNARCKFKLSEIRQVYYSEGKYLIFRAEYDSSIPEDQRFMKDTPNASMEIFVKNPVILNNVELGKSYYFNITPAE